MATCPVEFNDLEDLWQLFIWFFVVIGVYALLSRFWDSNHYAFLRLYTFLLPEWLHELAVIALLSSLSYAGWRVWWCGAEPQPKPITGYTSYGWDNAPIPLFLHVIFVAAFALQPLILHRTKQYVLNAIWALITVALCIAVMVFFFFADTLAAIIMVVALIFTSYWLGASINMAFQTTAITTSRKSFDDSILVEENAKASDMEVTISSKYQQPLQKLNNVESRLHQRRSIPAAITPRHVDAGDFSV